MENSIRGHDGSRSDQLSPSQLSAAGGIAIIGAGLFVSAWATSVLLENPSVGGVEVARSLAVPAYILMLLGLGAIYRVHAEETGAWGLIGFLMTFFGVSIFIGYVIAGWTGGNTRTQTGAGGRRTLASWTSHPGGSDLASQRAFRLGGRALSAGSTNLRC